MGNDMDSEIEQSSIAGILKQQYGLDVVRVTDAPRGFAAETHYVDTAEASYFLKMMHYPRRQKIFVHGLRVVEALAQQGIDYIPRVLRTASGALHCEVGTSPAALFTRMDAKQTYHYDREDVFRKLAQIYRVSRDIPGKETFMQEQFGDWFISRYEEALQTFMQGELHTEEAREVRAMLEPYDEFLRRCPAIAAEAVAGCRQERAEFVLTHSDFPGNVMVSETGQHYLIDFDETIYGPMERDGFMVIAADNEESKLWLTVMKEAFPDYEVNRTFIRYYVYERFMVDMASFLHDLQHHSDAGFRGRVVGSMRDYMLGWLHPMLLRYA
jgi:Ser/Thr protein kinase RdoA (MazF antagonist)